MISTVTSLWKRAKYIWLVWGQLINATEYSCNTGFNIFTCHPTLLLDNNDLVEIVNVAIDYRAGTALNNKLIGNSM